MKRKATRTTRSERGSLFLVAILTLFILTLVGLSLAVVTETEMLLGGNEWAIQEIHYAAEAGINVQVAQMLVGGDPAAKTFALPSYFGQKQQNQLGFDIRTTGLSEISRGPLPYSSANEGRASVDYGYYFMMSRAQRTAWSKGADVPTCADLEKNQLGYKTITTGFYLAPLEGASAEALLERDRSKDLKNVFGAFTVLGTGDEDICPFETQANALINVEQSFDSEANNLDTIKNNSGTATDVLVRGNSLYYGY